MVRLHNRFVAFYHSIYDQWGAATPIAMQIGRLTVTLETVLTQALLLEQAQEPL